jgi:hypothetical protein
MPKRKPKVDEHLLYLRLIERQMKRHDKVGLYGMPGEGKSTVIRALREKFRNTDWRFYDAGEMPVVEPYVYCFISEIQEVPPFDIIICMQYSEDYKESRTGVTFSDDEWHPMRDYAQKSEQRRMAKLNITGKTVKNMAALTKLLNDQLD